ncbi:voltage-dependent calcium channel beta subunit-associated regulatory protein-like isoform X1 [Cyprinus carpio]|uniref:Voltage-dependent calcium channel beta subunit-associated regulatory protein-like isoform X1 n=1 Tax=Cyprinus carpio TaxID=7962 RepID=A0A9Q9VMJ7_CYPCA|nr:voltage-dependent calcium channel beta subunit-associated regulatory protein-like isoform X1 [Cyprinus carpio]XP_042567786.1 voltage-dependent calcium channel beta subunit-associated regulatory protein-like isoform X1 [Cyprinus carpio]
MSNESAIWTHQNRTYPTDVPLLSGTQNGYVLLLVLLSIFVGGTLVLLSVLLIVCRRSCEGDRRHAWFIVCLRASDDTEKSNTTYVEEAQPVHEITIRVDESDCLSAASSHDMETERFLSTGTTGRRVSFNEAALFDHSKKTQEKGRRYTLTEGDFHHLKNARLTHLHLPAPALQILTIHECESSENSIAMTTCPVAKSSLSIFQPPVCSLPHTGLSPSSTLPGDTLNSTVDTTFCESITAASPEPSSPCLMEVRGGVGRSTGIMGNGREGASASSTALSSSGGAPQGPMLQFFTKLRRHASLEGASPYFKIKKWKFDSSQRASSLDMRGSPKRRQFQRQRAASESMDQEEHDSHHIDLIQYIARTKDVTYCPTRPSPRLLSPPSTPPPSLGRLEVEVMVEPSCSRATGTGVIGLTSEPPDESLGMGFHQESLEPQTLYRDIWTLRASLERYVSSDQSSNNDKDSIRSDADSVCSLGGKTEMGGLPRYPSQDIGDEMEGNADLPLDEGLEKGRKQDSVDSERGSDGEPGSRKLLQMDSGYTSIEAPSRAPEDLRLFGSSSSSKDGSAVERRHFFSSGHKGTVCESFDTDIFDEELEEEPAGASGGVDGVETDESTMLWSPYSQMFTQRDAQPHPPVLSRRDYSIDEKTEALFHEFLRHDPQFDQQESPLRSKHRSRVHLRKQWQRSKQYSDPGQRFQSSFDRYRTPLRRGETVNYPLETSYHSTLPRIISAPDEESSEGATSTPETPKADRETATEVDPNMIRISSSTESSGTINEKEVLEASQPPPMTDIAGEQSVGQENSRQMLPPPEPPDECTPECTSYGPQTITEELSDKLAATLEERLYSDLRRTREPPECSAVTVTYTSPNHSPV